MYYARYYDFCCASVRWQFAHAAWDARFVTGIIVIMPTSAHRVGNFVGNIISLLDASID
jgi:hypothetical protein